MNTYIHTYTYIYIYVYWYIYIYLSRYIYQLSIFLSSGKTDGTVNVAVRCSLVVGRGLTELRVSDYLITGEVVPNDILALCHGHGPSSDLCQDLLLSCDIGRAIWSQG